MRATRREWIGLGVLLLPLLLVSMDVSVLYFAVPFISRDLEPTSTQQLWIFDVYGFVLAGLLITMGSIGDRIGRRRLLLIGAAAFGAVSVIAAYAQSAETLIAARALMGIAGATLMPSTLALIRNMFHDEKQRSTAVTIWTAGLTFGVALGPILSGFLLEHFWWGSVFLINTPFMLMLLLLAPLLVPEFRGSVTRFDLVSSVLSLGAVLPAIYGIKEIAAHGVNPTRLAAVGVGLVLGAVFILRQRVRRDPMIDLGLFRQRAFGASLLTNLIAMFALAGFAIYSTQYLQSVLGLAPLTAALWSLLASVGIGAAAPIAGALSQRGVNKAYLIASGFMLSTAGFLILTRLAVDSSVWLILAGAGLTSAGLVVVMSLTTEAIMTATPPDRAGSAAALQETGSEFGGALGMAMLGSIGTAVYRADLSGFPDSARETLGGALAATDAVRAAAREAFVHGLHVVALTAAVLMGVAALVALLFLRRGSAQVVGAGAGAVAVAGEAGGLGTVAPATSAQRV
jgi:DHA2 family multidrug resistance protein-like MFS transporter